MRGKRLIGFETVEVTRGPSQTSGWNRRKLAVAGAPQLGALATMYQPHCPGLVPGVYLVPSDYEYGVINLLTSV